MHVAIITAGGAGMFCGSCMHDNTWARALMQSGVEVTLIPTYTPIRVDEEDFSSRRVFFGGINVYLAARWSFWRKLPRWMTRWLDHPGVLKVVTRLAISNNAAELGELTLAMLRGEHGPHRAAVDELVTFLADELKPDVICFSNALLAGAVRTLKERFRGPVLCTLQGDDIFLEGLPAEYRSRVIELLSDRAADFDGFLVHSLFYRDRMAAMLNLPVDRFRKIPLGIDVTAFEPPVSQSASRESPGVRIGYFARICPEKGLHQLIDAFRLVRREEPSVKLVAGGYLGPRDEHWFAGLCRDCRDLGDAFEYLGSPDNHADKQRMLESFDIFCVPTVYQEPKGLSVLEALTCGVPVVQPAHGAFPELLAMSGGGVLCRPLDPQDLAEKLLLLIRDPALRRQLGSEGREHVRTSLSMPAIASATAAVFSEFQAGLTS